MTCPRCGSERTSSQAVTETTSHGKTKGFGAGKSCLGALIFGPLGILCGLCGMGKGKTKTTTNVRVITICQDCGNHF